MMRAAGSFLLLGVFALSSCAAPEAGLSTITDADRAGIEAATYDYFDGQGYADFARLDRAFADNATMHGVMTAEDGSQILRQWPDFQSTLQAWGNGENPPGARDSEILDIHVTDGRIATVHFRSADRFYDTLTLVKIDGDWVIATKVFVRQQV